MYPTREEHLTQAVGSPLCLYRRKGQVPSRSLTIEQVLTALADAPPRIDESIVGLTETQLHAAPGPGEWSANEVLAHRRSCADVWGDCIVKILNQDTPTIRA